MDDDVLEGDENFEVNVMTSQSSGNLVNITLPQASVIIEDNERGMCCMSDCVILRVISHNYKFSESEKTNSNELCESVCQIMYTPISIDFMQQLNCQLWKPKF